MTEQPNYNESHLAKFNFDPEKAMEGIDINYALDDEESLINLLNNLKNNSDWEAYKIEDMFWQLKTDEADYEKMHEYTQKRDLYILKKALNNEFDGKLDTEWNIDNLKKLLLAIEKIKYFPVMYVSAPHIEGDVSGSFPGEPTPLLFATSVVDNYVTLNNFPSLKTPQTMAIMNPAEYSDQFEQELIQKLQTYKPKVLGISNVSEGHHFALKIARIIKRESPDTILIMGGAHEDGTNPVVYKRASDDVETGKRPQLEPEIFQLPPEAIERVKQLRTLKTKEEKDLIDLVVSGDGSFIMMYLMKTIADNPNIDAKTLKKQLLDNKEEIASIYGSGNLAFHNEQTGEIEDLELSGISAAKTNLPFLDRTKLTRENRFPIFGGKKTAQVMAGFGCVHACEYCCESGESALYRTPKTQQKNAKDVITELLLLKNQGYNAVFFDDSTFTQNHRKTHEMIIKGEKCTMSEVEFLLWHMQNEKERYEKERKEDYIEWGCQTTITDLDEDLVIKMGKAGCTYIYLGIENFGIKGSSMIEKTRTLKGERTWEEQFIEVAKWCKKANIRVGTSLQFGIDDSPKQRKNTIDLIGKYYKEGLIAKNCVSLNINTPYPGTKQWLRLLKTIEIKMPDYRERLLRHPRFETAHQFASLQWEVADELWEYALKVIGEGLIGVSFKSEAMEAKALAEKQSFSADFYFDDSYGPYLDGEFEASHFNSSSLSAPFPEAREEAKSVFELEQNNKIDKKAKLAYYEKARQAAAELINHKDETGVVLARNTTEAASLCYYLADICPGDQVILTTAENVSIQRLFEVEMDHGNPDRQDGWSAWPTWFANSGKKYPDIKRRRTNIDTLVLDVSSGDTDKIKKLLSKQIQKNTKVLCFSHVLRDTGAVMPVTEICELTRQIKAKKNPKDPEIFILVDGAQALGNVPSVDFETLGCDAYVATPHKTMKSEVAGLLFFDPKNKRLQTGLKKLKKAKQYPLILEGMFAPELGIKETVKDQLSCADIAGFSTACKTMQKLGLENNDFSKIDSLRKKLRNYCINKLNKTNLPIEIIGQGNQSNFILSFRISGVNGRPIAEELAKRGFYLSYIHGGQGEKRYFRVSFQVDNDKKQIDSLVAEMVKVYNKMKP
jgi:selenocysteine lyase/cysteine desulfurase/radical SAM superfamily enzyme YgiQ (UPF0313 family)